MERSRLLVTVRAEHGLRQATVSLIMTFSLKIEMPYELNPEQYKAVIALDGEQRCSHFIRRIADWEALWGVRNEEGWLVPVTPEGFEYFPVWPHPNYAQTITDKNYPGHQATEIPLEEFMTEWLPRFEVDKVKVAVFPNEDWSMWIMEPSDLLEALADEIAQYEE